MEESNTTEEDIEQLIEKQDALYRELFKYSIINQDHVFQITNRFRTKDLALAKKISINKRQGNTYAVIRDQKKLDSHKIATASYYLLKGVLIDAGKYQVETYHENLNKAIIHNQEKLKNINSNLYEDIASLEGEGLLKEAQASIKEYKQLLEVNADLIKYLAIYQDEIYTLSKYSLFDIASLLIYIDESEVGKQINPLLKSVNLDSIKVAMIFIILLLITVIRKIIQFITNYLLKTILKSRTDALEILERLRPHITFLVLFITLDLILIVLTDFQPAVELKKITAMIYTIIITLLLYKTANTIAILKLEGLQKHTQHIRKEVVNVAIKVANVIIFTIGLLFILHFYGFNLSAVLSGLGIGGLAVAFAARETIANLFGTVSILMSNNYSQGDWIAVDAHEGTIVEIGLRDTTLRTFDNAMITIPNAVLANNNVKNWSKRKVGRRIKMHIGVTYQSDFGDIKKAVEAIKQMLIDHEDIATEQTSYTSSRRALSFLNDEDVSGVKRTILVYMDQFSGSSIDILVYCFSKSVVWSQWLETKEDVMYKIADILKENKLEFAYPTMTLDMPKMEEA